LKIFAMAALAAFFYACNPAAAEIQSAADFFAADRAAKPVATIVATRRHNPPAELHAMVTRSAARHGVPPKLAHAVIAAESGYRCNARSRSGAKGIAQVMPATARGVGVHGDLYDCATGLEAGMRYLGAIVRQHGTGCAAVALYERGAYARPVCTAYGRKVIALKGGAP